MNVRGTFASACAGALLLLATADLHAQPAGSQGQGQGQGGNMMQRIAQMDADGDGQITREEWQGRPQGFDRLDRDGDGVITREELRAARQAGGQGQRADAANAEAGE